MAFLVSLLGAVTTLICAVLLLRQYLVTRQKLLAWSGLCFTGMTISNVLLCLDQVSGDPHLYVPRLCAAAIGMALLVYGLVWEGERS